MFDLSRPQSQSKHLTPFQNTVMDPAGLENPH